MDLGEAAPRLPVKALLNRANHYIDLWDKTSCVEIEILTGMVDAREAYYAAPDLVRDLVAEVERLLSATQDKS